jgi:outer membrane protein OmpA-like peptidoglycan-associated protein
MRGVLVSGLLGALAWAAPAALWAEPRLAIEGPVRAVAGDPSLLAASPGAVGSGTLRAVALLQLASEPLVLTAPSQNVHAVVSRQLWVQLGASYAIAHRFLLAAAVPALLEQQGQARPFDAALAPASEGLALGDPYLVLRSRVLGDADGFALGLGLAGALPLATSTYAGDPALRLQPFVAGGHHNRRGFSAFQLGFTWRQNQTLPGVLPTRVGSSVELALAGGLTLDPGQSTRLGPELAASTTVGNGAKLLDARSTAVTLLLHLEHRLRKGPFTVGAALGPSLGRAPGAADYRAVLRLAFAPQPPLPPPDSDDDTVPDTTDMCPSLRGEPSNDPLMHGCPPLPSDFDGDGIPDTLDACPRTVGEPQLERKLHGCPKLAAPPPPPPATPPPPPAATLEASKITISEQVQFETGTAQLRAESSAILEQVAQVLIKNPEIELLEVAGHTDDTGTDELNLRLSRERAGAVLEWLVSHGVDRQRLRAEGYGRKHPLDDNTSEGGRAKNRRVEFVVMRRSGSPAGAP